jgi:hypothetical protein
MIISKAKYDKNPEKYRVVKTSNGRTMYMDDEMPKRAKAGSNIAKAKAKAKAEPKAKAKAKAEVKVEAKAETKKKRKGPRVAVEAEAVEVI